jgi:hypothetical protein
MLGGSSSKGLRNRISYYSRIIPAYFGGGTSQLSFWHERPAINPNCLYDSIGEYYMTFDDKAAYAGPFDGVGIPLLDYRGKIGRQYNPIAIAQYGLANWNRYMRLGEREYFQRAKKQADWLVENLVENRYGVPVWNHDFDWEYREILKAPWYSGLAQGNGISLLVRVAHETGEEKYSSATEKAYHSMTLPIDEGGVIYIDDKGDRWIEEVIITPPTHILNGFLWALWGVWDYYLLTGKNEVKRDFESFVSTLCNNLHRYDIGYWSLYELSSLKLRMVASPFYHSLHCIQLEATSNLTGRGIFRDYAERWENYAKSLLNRGRALSAKALFKVVYY